MPQHTASEKRKNRRGSAALRALKSAPKSVRQAIKQGTGIKDMRERRIAAGKIIRKGRIARSSNPNTGKGSLAKHTVRRAVARGKIGKKQGRKTLKAFKRGRVSETSGRGTKGRLANRGAAISKLAKGRKRLRKLPATQSTFSRLAKFQVHKNKDHRGPVNLFGVSPNRSTAAKKAKKAASSNRRAPKAERQARNAAALRRGDPRAKAIAKKAVVKSATGGKRTVFDRFSRLQKDARVSNTARRRSAR